MKGFLKSPFLLVARNVRILGGSVGRSSLREGRGGRCVRSTDGVRGDPEEMGTL